MALSSAHSAFAVEMISKTRKSLIVTLKLLNALISCYVGMILFRIEILLINAERLKSASFCGNMK